MVTGELVVDSGSASWASVGHFDTVRPIFVKDSHTLTTLRRKLTSSGVKLSERGNQSI